MECKLYNKEDLLKLYCDNMREIKRRTIAITEIFNKTKSTSFQATNIEFCCLQLRKIIELVILSSLITNKNKYEEIYNGLKNDWNAKKISDNLSAINLNYFPKPIRKEKIVGVEKDNLLNNGIDPKNITDKFFNDVENTITETEIIDAYYKLSSYMHARNPFAKGTKYNIESYIMEILNKIINLLNCHQVFLYDSDYFFYIVMQSKETGDVAGNIFQKMTI